MIKICKKCNKEKNVEEFYVHSKMGDGRLSFCKECVKERVRIYSHTDRGREVDRKRNTTERGKERQARHRKKYRRIYPEKYRAVRLAYEAFRRGDLTKYPCTMCGDAKSEMHHDDYSKPLEVRWLCRKHHREHHYEKDGF